MANTPNPEFECKDIPAVVWRSNKALIQDLVKRFTLVRVAGPGLKNGPHVGPHLHLGNDIYVATSAAWKAFTEKMKPEVAKKVGKATKVSFTNAAQTTKRFA